MKRNQNGNQNPQGALHQMLLGRPPFVLGVSGSRRLRDVGLASFVLSESLKAWGVGVKDFRFLAHGACPTGFDTLADRWARAHELEVREYRVADPTKPWEYHRRNLEIARVCTHGVLCLFNGPHTERSARGWNRGTKNTHQHLKKLKKLSSVKVWVVDEFKGSARMFHADQEAWIHHPS